MKKMLVFFLSAALGMLGASASLAGDHAETQTEKKTVIALKTSDFELAETDISDLAVGESETIVTDSGRTIDLLRTEDGVEVYVDGELLELNAGDDARMHGEHHVIHKRVEVVCDSEAEQECEKTVWVSDGEDLGDATLHQGTGEHGVIRKEIVIECDGEEDCAEHDIWITDGEDFDLEAMQEHADAHGMVMIRKGDGEADFTAGEDGEIPALEENEKVIIVKKKVHRD